MNATETRSEVLANGGAIPEIVDPQLSSNSTDNILACRSTGDAADPNYVVPAGASLITSRTMDSGRQACKAVLVRLQQELNSLSSIAEETDRKIRHVGIVLEWLDTKLRTTECVPASISVPPAETPQPSLETESDLRHECHNLLMDSNVALTVGQICSELMRQARALQWHGDPLFSVCKVLQELAKEGLVVANEVNGIRKWQLTTTRQSPDLLETTLSDHG